MEHYVLDTFPLPVCENVRAPRRLAPGLTYRGYIPSKRAYFHGLKLHLVCNNHPFITEVLCTPGSVAAAQGLYLLPLDLAQGSALYVDRGTWQRTTWRWPRASGCELFARGTPGATTNPVSSSPPWAGRSSSRWVPP